MTEQATTINRADKPADLTARVAVFPSAMIKPVPPFIFSVPDGWVLDDAPDALVVARTAEPVDGFWVNAILSHDRVPRAVDFKQAAQATWAQAAEVVAVREGHDGAPRALRHATSCTCAASSSRRPSRVARSRSCTRCSSRRRRTRARPSTSSSSSRRAHKTHMDAYGPAFVELVGSFRFTPAA